VTSPTESFVERKIALALALAEGQHGGTYGDAILILSSVMSRVNLGDKARQSG
jgi:hypothetical protein